MASHNSAPPDHTRGFPTRRLWGSVREVPDFSHIPRERWEDAMRAIPVRLREAAVRQLAMPLEDTAALMELAWSDLPPAPSDRAREAIVASPRLAPAPPRARVRTADRQVNFRLTRSEYADLATAAALLGYTPSKLASELVRYGVQRVIEEADGQDG